LIGNWVHLLPDSAYPGPNLDYPHEMERFFAYWLKGTNNGVMDESPLTSFRREYTVPAAFPTHPNGVWQSVPNYPIPYSLPRRSFVAPNAAHHPEQTADSLAPVGRIHAASRKERLLLIDLPKSPAPTTLLIQRQYCP
jgi:hypothetical protein